MRFWETLFQTRSMRSNCLYIGRRPSIYSPESVDSAFSTPTPSLLIATSPTWYLHLPTPDMYRLTILAALCGLAMHATANSITMIEWTDPHDSLHKTCSACK